MVNPCVHWVHVTPIIYILDILENKVLYWLPPKTRLSLSVVDVEPSHLPSVCSCPLSQLVSKLTPQNSRRPRFWRSSPIFQILCHFVTLHSPRTLLHIRQSQSKICPCGDLMSTTPNSKLSRKKRVIICIAFSTTSIPSTSFALFLEWVSSRSSLNCTLVWMNPHLGLLPTYLGYL